MARIVGGSTGNRRAGRVDPRVGFPSCRLVWVLKLCARLESEHSYAVCPPLPRGPPLLCALGKGAARGRWPSWVHLSPSGFQTHSVIRTEDGKTETAERLASGLWPPGCSPVAGPASWGPGSTVPALPLTVPPPAPSTGGGGLISFCRPSALTRASVNCPFVKPGRGRIAPPDSCAGVLTPSTPERDRIWRRGLYRGD